MNSGHGKKLAIRCLLWSSSRLVLQPWVSDSWINRSACSALVGTTSQEEKTQNLAARGPFGDPGHPFHPLPFSLLHKPFTAITQTRLCKHRDSTSLSATQCQAGRKVVPPQPRMACSLPPHPEGSLAHRGHPIVHWPDTQSFPSNHLSSVVIY